MRSDLVRYDYWLVDRIKANLSDNIVSANFIEQLIERYEEAFEQIKYLQRELENKDE